MPVKGNTHLDKVCDVCGDIGWWEAVSACCQCNIRRHGYCMRVLVPTVLKDWVCEECLPRNNVDSLKSGRIGHVPNTSRKVYLELPRRVARRGLKTVETGKVKFLPTEEAIKLSSGSTKNEFDFTSNFRSKPELAKFAASPFKRTFTGLKTVGPCVNPISVRPNPSFLSFGNGKPPGFVGVQKSSSSSQHAAKKLKESKQEKVPQPLAKRYSRNEEPLSSVMSAKEVKNSTADARTRSIMKETLSKSATSTPRLPIINAGKKVESALVVSRKENVHKELILDVIQPVKEHTVLDTKNEGATKSSRSSPSRFHATIACSGQNFQDASEPKNSIVAERETCNNQLKIALYLPHVPSPYIIWTGGFKFLDTAVRGEFYGGFFAKPPCIVNRKAYQLSEKMPSVLQVNLLHQCDLHADLFQNGCLDVCDIALYFFPADYIERSQENYSQLSQLMEINKSVMKSDLDGVELFIFSSKQLHVDSQNVETFPRLNLEFFCGVFRRAKDNQMKVNQKVPSLVSPLGHKHVDNADMDCGEAVDMDIDMVGGQVVGIQDMAVSRELDRDLRKWALKETLLAITDRKLSTVLGDSDRMIQPISVDLDSIIQPISVVFKQECCDDSDLPCEITKKIISASAMEHPSETSHGTLPGSMAETDTPPGFEGMLKLSSTSRAPKVPNGEEKKGLGERQVVSRIKEEIGCQGILQLTYGDSPQPEGTIGDSGLRGTKKHSQSQMLVDDPVNHPSSACSPPPCLSRKGSKVGSIIKAEGADNEKPFETREKKGLQVSPFFSKDHSRIISAAVCGAWPVEVKAEVHEEVNNPSAACPPRLLDKGTKVGLEVQGRDLEKPIETRENKGLQGSSFHGEGKSKTITGSFNPPCAGDVKVEMKVKNDRASTCPGLNDSLPSNMIVSVCSGPLASTWVKLSVAGRTRGSRGAASAGGLLRDESGKWIVGYNLNLGFCSSLATDLWALYQGTKLTWDKGYRKVLVELDSIAAAECLKKPFSLLDTNRALVESCRDLLNCKWDCKVSTITREENKCADWLATNVERGKWGLSVIREPPLKLIPVLENDCKRLPHDTQCSISKSP